MKELGNAESQSPLAEQSSRELAPADEVARENFAAVIAIKRKSGSDVVTIQTQKEHLFSTGELKRSCFLADRLSQLLPTGRKTVRGNSRYR